MKLRPLTGSLVSALVSAVFVAGAGLSAAGCGSDGGPSPTSKTTTTGDTQVTPEAAPSGVWVVYGEDIPQPVRDRITSLLTEALAAEGKVPQVVAQAQLPEALAADALVLSFGGTALTRRVIGEPEIAGLGAEGFVVRRGKLGEATLLAADGRPAEAHAHGNLGALHGAYALLEELGFGFLHPLAPTVPPSLSVPAAPFELRSAPRWKKRAIHLHTMHPLELTELLQGWGKSGPSDETGFEAMLPEWDRYLEWAVANGQNGVEWFLLWADSWKDFADSDVRIGRLTRLVERAHAFGIMAGIDAPVAFKQQHSFRLLRTSGELPAELTEIRTRLDWLMRAKWDFVGIEAGTSEFTAPDASRMLAWMNEVAKHLDEKHAGTSSYIKVHCSTGQTAAGYPDPVTGQDINFNFLPHHADKRLGVLPHTVQHYALTDPAPTYGNTDFGYMRDFIRAEAGSRPVVFYPETAYWVSFDVDVPLFLPIYADRRLHDLRLLAGDEDAGLMGLGVNKGAKMDGQLVFSSGWEWGYWLNDVVAARSAWQPERGPATSNAALRQALAKYLRVFGAASGEVVTWIADVAEAEQALLIEGRVNGVAPTDIVKRNGQAYLQGWETWDDVNVLAKKAGMSTLKETQPDKIGLVEMRNPFVGGPAYTGEVELLLGEMEDRFATLAARGDALRAKVPAHARPLFDDMADAMRVTALRAAQVHGLYDYVDGYYDRSLSERLPRLNVARKALDDAQLVVTGREAKYRVPAERIAGWRPNPTAYEYGYLWTVRRLFFWWRDEGKAVDAPLLPCYLNHINPVDIAFGEGQGTDTAKVFGDLLSDADTQTCLAEPAAELTFPQAGLRTRP